MTFQPSNYQQEIFNFVLNQTGNASVNAVAGSGKTTTLIEAAKLLDQKGKYLFCAFNVSIAKELGERLRESSFKCATIHAIGKACLENHFERKFSIDQNKYKLLCTENYGYLKKKSRKALYRILSLVQLNLLTKADLPDITGQQIWEIACTYDIDIELKETIKIAHQVDIILQLGKLEIKTKGIIDFNDMLWGCYAYGVEGPNYDFIFVDEAQDLNEAQLWIIKNCARNKESRFLICGDSSQAIYLFAGAGKGMFQKISDDLKCKHLPLSISYRCPKKIVGVARKLVPQIESFEEQNQGQIYNIKHLPDTLPDDTFILCRTISPMVKACLKFISEGKKAVIKGKDIGYSLSQICEQFNYERFIENLNTYQKSKIDEFLKRPNYEELIENLGDKCACIEALYEGFFSKYKSYPENHTSFSFFILSMFEETTDCPTFMSIHKSKGLQAKNIYLINPEQLPHKAAKTPQAIEQEKNLAYIAITRTLDTLTIVGKWDYVKIQYDKVEIAEIPDYVYQNYGYEKIIHEYVEPDGNEIIETELGEFIIDERTILTTGQAIKLLGFILKNHPDWI